MLCEGDIFIIIFILTLPKSIICNISFKTFPDRDHFDIFTIKIVSDSVKEFSKVVVKNESGYLCAEMYNLQSTTEITGLLCRYCRDNNLHVSIDYRNFNNSNLSRNFTVSENKKRKEICSIQPLKRNAGENVTFLSPLSYNDSCRFIFRNSNGYTGCCYSNRDFYTQVGGCDPLMQSKNCRKEKQTPELSVSGNFCIFHIPYLLPSDEGNYLSNFEHETPQFKSNLVINSSHSFQLGLIIIIITLVCAFVCVLLVLSEKRPT